jgi:hypothetical protein
MYLANKIITILLEFLVAWPTDVFSIVYIYFYTTLFAREFICISSFNLYVKNNVYVCISAIQSNISSHFKNTRYYCTLISDLLISLFYFTCRLT